jgi:hypothetical protein
MQANFARVSTDTVKLAKLALSKHDVVLEAVARNPNTPPHVLVEISGLRDTRLLFVARELSGINKDVKEEIGSHTETQGSMKYGYYCEEVVVIDYKYTYGLKSCNIALGILFKHPKDIDKIMEKLKELNRELYDALKDKV